MPSLSPTMTAGTIASWKKQEGESLKAGDILCEIETDKASVGFEVQDDGVLAKILVQAQGSEIACGSPIALMVEDSAAYTAFLKLDPSEHGITSAAPPPTTTTTAAAAGVAVASSASATHNTGRTPLIKFLGKRSKLAAASADSKVSPASASHVSAVSAPSSSSPPRPSVQWVEPPAGAPVNAFFTDIPNSNMRKVIAKRLTESKSTVPHFYVTIDCEIDELLAVRKALKASFDSNVSVNDLVIKSAALALRDMPQVAAKYNKATGKVEAGAGGVSDIAVAVATPNGLITPIVKAAHELGVAQVNSAVKDLAGRAREGKLKPEEYQGGSFSISNLGMFGISSFSAVINPPQACILAVGAGVPRVLPPKQSGPGAKPRLATVVSVQLSADRRVVDEAAASQFLQIMRNYLSSPKQLML
jgi:pyruvate dehydrogenase E2 component (dihydrolipoamide acetyltransferase)